MNLFRSAKKQPPAPDVLSQTVLKLKNTVQTLEKRSVVLIDVVDYTYLGHTLLSSQGRLISKRRSGHS